MRAPARAGADLRLLRAAVFAVVCVTLSAAGHAWASGMTIPLWALVVAWAVVFAVAAPLAGRERSLPGITALMVFGQTALHLVFSTGQWCVTTPAGPVDDRAARVMALAGRLVCGGGEPLRLTPAGALALVRRAGIDPAAAPPVTGGPGAAHVAHAASAMAGMPGMPGMAAAHGGMGLSWQMVCGHLVAGIVVGWLLRRGEAALWRLVRLSAVTARWLARRLPVLSAVVAAVLALTAAGAHAAAVPRRGRRERETGVRPQSVCLRHAVARRGPPAWALAA